MPPTERKMLALLKAVETLPPPTRALDVERARALGTSTKPEVAFAAALEALLATVELPPKPPLDMWAGQETSAANIDVILELIGVLLTTTDSRDLITTASVVNAAMEAAGNIRVDYHPKVLKAWPEETRRDLEEHLADVEEVHRVHPAWRPYVAVSKKRILDQLAQLARIRR